MTTSTPLKRIARLTTDNIDRGTRPLLGLEHLESGTGRLRPDASLPEVVAPGAGVADVAVGDVLFGKLRPYLAKSWVADRSAFASTELLCLRPQPGIDPRWLGYLVASSSVVDWAVATSDGTKMPRTSWDKLGEYRAIVPSLAAQRTLADHLDHETARIDALVSAKRRMVELLQERRESSTASLVERATDVGASRPVWTLMRPREVTGAPHLEVLSVYRDFGVIPKSSRSDNYNKTPEDLSRYQVVAPGNVVVNKMKAWQGSIGVSSYRGIVSPDYLVCEVTGAIDSGYLHHLLRSPQLRTEFQHRSEGIRPSQWRLQWDQLRLITLPIPQAEDQQCIAEAHAGEVMRSQALAYALDRQLGLLQEHRQALITAAITEQINISEAA